MQQLTLDEMVELEVKTGKMVFPVNDPCFLYNDCAYTCKTRALYLDAHPNSFDISYVHELVKHEVYKHIKHEDGNLIFVLGHEVSFSMNESNGPRTMYKIRYEAVEYTNES